MTRIVFLANWVTHIELDCCVALRFIKSDCLIGHPHMGLSRRPPSGDYKLRAGILNAAFVVLAHPWTDLFCDSPMDDRGYTWTVLGQRRLVTLRRCQDNLMNLFITSCIFMLCWVFSCYTRYSNILPHNVSCWHCVSVWGDDRYRLSSVIQVLSIIYDIHNCTCW